MYLYETHLHTFPVSKCAKTDVRQSLEYYKNLGYKGVFITNHFINGNINVDRSLPYEERINFYFSDFELGARLSKEVGIDVFCGVEMSYKGTDFLVYGLDKEWYLAHPEIEEMKMRALLELLIDNGALVIQAHPYREASYIDHIRLFPRSVHGIEIYNACQDDMRNEMAEHYANMYGLIHFAGSDNHNASKPRDLGGMMSDTPIIDENDFVLRVKSGDMSIFKNKLS